MSCLALSCLVAAAAAATAATAAGSAGPAAAVAAPYLPTIYRVACATGGTRSSRHWPGGRGGNSPACLTRSPCRALFGLHPSLHLYLVVKFASHCVFQQNHSK